MNAQTFAGEMPAWEHQDMFARVFRSWYALVAAARRVGTTSTRIVVCLAHTCGFARQVVTTDYRGGRGCLSLKRKWLHACFLHPKYTFSVSTCSQRLQMRSLCGLVSEVKQRRHRLLKMDMQSKRHSYQKLSCKTLSSRCSKQYIARNISRLSWHAKSFELKPQDSPSKSLLCNWTLASSQSYSLMPGEMWSHVLSLLATLTTRLLKAWQKDLGLSMQDMS